MFFGLFMRYRKFLVIDSDEGNMPLGLVVGSRVLAVRFWKLGTFNHSQIMAKLSDCLPNFVCFSKDFTFDDFGLFLSFFSLTKSAFSFISFTLVTNWNLGPFDSLGNYSWKVRVENSKLGWKSGKKESQNPLLVRPKRRVGFEEPGGLYFKLAQWPTDI